MSDLKTNYGIEYHILIKESLTHAPGEWLDNLQIITLENGSTLLTGAFADQSALRGFMNRLWDFNFTVLRLERSENGQTD